MTLEFQVLEAFGPDGAIARATDHFAARSGQTEMAVAVARAIEGAYPLVVEASTGVGKTFSYLVPALLSGERVLLSTATKALQDQLFGRDLPMLVKALRVPVSTALLKGRGSYLCLHRMEMARHDPGFPERSALRTLAKIEEWARLTVSGDLAELPGLDERSPVIPWVTSTRENCLGAPCPRFRACHVNHARREALAADVVVINHHLFFADMAVRESGVAELLPTVRIAIFDEAHQLNETGVQFLGKNLSTGQLLDFSRDMLATGLQLARGLADWQALAGAVEHTARELRLNVGQAYPGSKLRWTDATPEGLHEKEWASALSSLSACLDVAGKALNTVSEIAPDFVRLNERATELAERALGFSCAADPGGVRWLEVGTQLRLVEAPLDIAKSIAAIVFPTDQEAAKSWIFTSATLGDDERLSWFTRPCGLAEAELLRVGSPFDYARQAAFYVPKNFPKPGDPAHPAAVAVSAADWARRLGGRTMVLTTTLRALRSIGDALQATFENSTDMQVLVQGAMPKRALIERFRQADQHGSRGCVLVASASFWEGIDVPGDALQLVIIDKLPFPPPNDPMVEARSRLLEAAGGSAFNDYFLPEAAVALKQGAGRLIRRETDQGVLVVCDGRLATMGYGKRLMRALPAMQRLVSEEELFERLDLLTRTCTTAHPPSWSPWTGTRSGDSSSP
ncbi:MAG: ATP-dependent DNA helicase [Polaromonas sp.]|uniref:ATP-dependent DNA helicase n=1 Tax=Polaromonas sp. TaxID=1869339 RepID=UPI002736302B|nr:ATP-dependent DNA helicase [Polaromonas sp.]MDP1952852.1 ATP-dependent DNA helicase [Polaromonas sp.]MDP3356699.1 ATP-dependent DNA helicase [Polaromonas sp.]MDP3755659.1 ATP-dependent DNA helicase [Polaromonas sp.]